MSLALIVRLEKRYDKGITLGWIVHLSENSIDKNLWNQLKRQHFKGAAAS